MVCCIDGAEGGLEGMDKFDTSLEIVKFIQQLYTSMNGFAHQYTSEVCYSGCSEMIGSIPWSPNLCFSKEDEEYDIRDWRARSILLPNEEPRELESASETHPSGGPLVQFVVNNGKLYANEVYVPLCPMEEAFNGSLYTSSADSMSNFIGQSVIIVCRRVMEKKPSESLEEKIYQEAVNSDILLKRFKDCLLYTSPSPRDA